MKLLVTLFLALCVFHVRAASSDWLGCEINFMHFGCPVCSAQSGCKACMKDGKLITCQDTESTCENGEAVVGDPHTTAAECETLCVGTSTACDNKYTNCAGLESCADCVKAGCYGVVDASGAWTSCQANAVVTGTDELAFPAQATNQCRDVVSCGRNDKDKEGCGSGAFDRSVAAALSITLVALFTHL